MLTKITVEAALNAELDDHLGCERHEKASHSNNRNGFSSKTVQTVVSIFFRTLYPELCRSAGIKLAQAGDYGYGIEL